MGALCTVVGVQSILYFVLLLTTKTDIGPHVSVRNFCPILNVSGVYQEIFVKVPNIKYHENHCSGNSADRWGQIDRRTDMTQLIGAFHDLRERAQKKGR